MAKLDGPRQMRVGVALVHVEGLCREHQSQFAQRSLRHAVVRCLLEEEVT